MVNPDRTFNLNIHQPPTSYFLKQAAGIQRGSMKACKEVVRLCISVNVTHHLLINQIKKHQEWSA